MLTCGFLLLLFFALHLYFCLKGKTRWNKLRLTVLAFVTWLVSRVITVLLVSVGKTVIVVHSFIFMRVSLLALIACIPAWLVYAIVCSVKNKKLWFWMLASVPFAIVILLFGAAVVIVREFPDDRYVSYYSVPEAVDRLEIYSFSYDHDKRRHIKTVTNPAAIRRYKNAFRWEDGHAICCDEQTVLLIYEYAGEERVGRSSCALFASAGYNNIGFTAQQLELLLLP